MIWFAIEQSDQRVEGAGRSSDGGANEHREEKVTWAKITTPALRRSCKKISRRKIENFLLFFSQLRTVIKRKLRDIENFGPKLGLRPGYEIMREATRECSGTWTILKVWIKVSRYWTSAEPGAGGGIKKKGSDSCRPCNLPRVERNNMKFFFWKLNRVIERKLRDIELKKFDLSKFHANRVLCAEFSDLCACYIGGVTGGRSRIRRPPLPPCPPSEAANGGKDKRFKALP